MENTTKAGWNNFRRSHFFNVSLITLAGMKKILLDVFTLIFCAFLFSCAQKENNTSGTNEKLTPLSRVIDSLARDTTGNNRYLKRLKNSLLVAGNDTGRVKKLNILSERMGDKMAIKITREALQLSQDNKFYPGEIEAGLRLALLMERKEKKPVAADSLITVYKKLALEKNNQEGLARVEQIKAEIGFLRGNIDTAFQLSKKAIDLALKTHNNYLIASCYKTESNYFLAKQDRENEVQVHKKAVEYARLSGDTVLLSSYLNRLGNLQRLLQDKSNALKNLQETMTLYEKIEDSQRLIIVLIDLGELYRIDLKNEEAQKYYNKALPYLGRVKEPAPKIYFYGSMGTNLKSLKKYDENIKYIQQGVDIAKEAKNQAMLAGCYIFMGETWYDKKNPGKAREYFELAMEQGKLINNFPVISACLLHLAMTEFEKGKFQEVLKLGTEGLKVSIEGQSLEDQKELSFLLFRTYDTLRNASMALKMHKQYVTLKDSLSNEASIKKFAEVEYSAKEAKLISEQESKEQALVLEQERRQVITAAESKKKNVIIFSVVFGLILLLIFSVVIFNRFKITQKQKQIIEKQKVIVDEKNKEILDSITYAKHLQQAILPSLDQINQCFSESFVLYKPKDIVAGDFYWMEVVESLEMRVKSATNTNNSQLILIAVADCTGHGVPGAMVSVVCSNALNRAVKEFGIIEPGKILDKVRELVVETFEKSGNEVKDGMDISLCAVFSTPNSEWQGKPAIVGNPLQHLTIQWAGANNALWYVHKGELKEIKPDKQPIGKYAEETPFTTHNLELASNDILYLFTDGYADQFGGRHGKKLKFKQLKDLVTTISGLPLKQQSAELDKSFEEWRGDIEQVDDVCVIGIKI
jgi:serine phosphatase RsbU (regulator of sigma subunit)